MGLLFIDKTSVVITVGNDKYEIYEDQWYVLEFKPELQLGGSEQSPFCTCQVLGDFPFFKDDNGRVHFLVLDEKSNEDYMICDDELLSITKLSR